VSSSDADDASPPVPPPHPEQHSAHTRPLAATYDAPASTYLSELHVEVRVLVLPPPAPSPLSRNSARTLTTIVCTTRGAHLPV
jgi:hypothetical protein